VLKLDHLRSRDNIQTSAICKFVKLASQMVHCGWSSWRRIILISYHIISHHILDFKWQSRLKVGTDKPKLKVKMQSVSDDDLQKTS